MKIARHLIVLACASITVACSNRSKNTAQPLRDTAQYIAFLERLTGLPGQKLDAIVTALGLTGKEVVADIGAGSLSGSRGPR
jgi:hypothetical protein